MMDDNTLNTFDKDEVDRVIKNGVRVEKCVDIKVYGINAVLQKYFADGRLDFLSVDIEGSDYEVLKAIQYDKIRPSVICTETLEFMGGKEEGLFDLIDFYKRIDYVLIADTWMNSIFIDMRQVTNKDFISRYLFWHEGGMGY